MIQLQNLLLNPEDDSFNLIEAEIYSFKEAYELIKNNQLKYSLFAIWNGVLINIQRRIEDFGITNFLEIIDKEDNFNKNEDSLKNRWILIDEYKIIDYARRLNLISDLTAQLVKTMYWIKTNTHTNDTDIIDENEIYSLLYLLERNLFIKEFKVDKRTNLNDKNGNLKRRVSDKIEENIIPQTHQEFLLKYGINVFKEDQEKSKEEKAKLISKYG